MTPDPADPRNRRFQCPIRSGISPVGGRRTESEQFVCEGISFGEQRLKRWCEARGKPLVVAAGRAIVPRIAERLQCRATRGVRHLVPRQRAMDRPPAALIERGIAHERSRGPQRLISGRRSIRIDLGIHPLSGERRKRGARARAQFCRDSVRGCGMTRPELLDDGRSRAPRLIGAHVGSLEEFPPNLSSSGEVCSRPTAQEGCRLSFMESQRCGNSGGVRVREQPDRDRLHRYAQLKLHSAVHADDCARPPPRCEATKDSQALDLGRRGSRFASPSQVQRDRVDELKFR